MLPLFSILHRRPCRHIILRRRVLQPFSTSSAAEPLNLPLTYPTYFIWSSNTSLGKTLVSAGLAASFLLSPNHLLRKRFLYLKPVQTGFPSDSDSRFVFSKVSALSLRQKLFRPILATDNVLKASIPAATATAAALPSGGVEEGSVLGMFDLDSYSECRIPGEEEGEPFELICKTLFAWRDAVSPHLAAERENGMVEDSSVLGMLQRCLERGLNCRFDEKKMNAFCVVETAGGIASPGPSGTLQCDLYRCLFLFPFLGFLLLSYSNTFEV